MNENTIICFRSNVIRVYSFFVMFSFAVESFLRYLEKFVDWCYDGIK